MRFIRQGIRLATLIAPLGAATLIFATSAHGATNAQTFSYQGRLLNSAGTAPLLDIIDLTFSIYNSMATLFSNTGAINGFGGCSYSPVAGDTRKLRVTLTPHSTGIPTTLTPDQSINSTPQTQTAETLQGLSPSSFVQTAGAVAGQGNVSLATLLQLTGGTDIGSTPHTHDSLYVKFGCGGTSANLGSSAWTSGSFGIGTNAPTGNLGFAGNVGAQVIEVNRNTTAASAGNSLSIVAGGATSGATNQNGGNLVLSSGTSTGTGGSSIQFQTSSSVASGTTDSAPSTKMVLTSSGNLGVGTTTPGAQLEVDSSGASVIIIVC